MKHGIDDHHIIAAWQSTGLTYEETLAVIEQHYDEYEQFAKQADLAYRRAARRSPRDASGRVLSLWAASRVGDENRLRMTIAATGGTTLFPVLLNSEGELVPARHIITHSGPTWVLYHSVEDANRDDAYGIALVPANDVTLARRGLLQAHQLRPARVQPAGHHITHTNPVVVPADGMHVNPKAPIFTPHPL